MTKKERIPQTCSVWFLATSLLCLSQLSSLGKRGVMMAAQTITVSATFIGNIGTIRASLGSSLEQPEMCLSFSRCA
jgi:hypothetical protein